MSRQTEKLARASVPRPFLLRIIVRILIVRTIMRKGEGLGTEAKLAPASSLP